jgi:hypothetical protein
METAHATHLGCLAAFAVAVTPLSTEIKQEVRYVESWMTELHVTRMT